MADRREYFPSRYPGAETVVGQVKRVSWGAIFAGTVVVLMVEAILAFLGMAIGFGAINPATDANPMEGVGTGAMIWWVISSLIALFLGGWVAARLAGPTRRWNGMMHGAVTFGLATLVAAWMVTTTIGAIVGGAFGIMQTGINAASNAAGAVYQERDRNMSDRDYENLTSEFEQLLNKAQASLGMDTTQQGQTGQQRRPTTGPATAGLDAEARNMLDRMYRNTGGNPSQADEERMVNYLMTNAEMSREEARNTVDRWNRTYAGSYRGDETGYRQTGMTDQQYRTQQAAQNVTDTASKASLWIFIMMILGVFAAIGGGAMATPEDIIVAEGRVGGTDVESGVIDPDFRDRDRDRDRDRGDRGIR